MAVWKSAGRTTRTAGRNGVEDDPSRCAEKDALAYDPPKREAGGEAFARETVMAWRPYA
jgi:hypothetical protein